MIHKSTRAEDGKQVGCIAADDDESIIVLAGKSREYSIPKSHVKDFDGSQVVLDFRSNELEQYRIV